MRSAASSDGAARRDEAVRDAYSSGGKDCDQKRLEAAGHGELKAARAVHSVRVGETDTCERTVSQLDGEGYADHGQRPGDHKAYGRHRMDQQRVHRTLASYRHDYHHVDNDLHRERSTHGERDINAYDQHPLIPRGIHHRRRVAQSQHRALSSREEREAS